MFDFGINGESLGNTRFRGSFIKALWSKLAYVRPSFGGRGGAVAGLVWFWFEADEELLDEEAGLVGAWFKGVLAAKVGVAVYTLLRESGSQSPFF